MAAAEKTMLRGNLQFNVSLRKLNSWRVGGPAARLYRPADVDDLSLFLTTMEPSEPLIWLGLGSNLLIRDGGINGTVIVLAGALDRLERIEPHHIRAGAGVPCAKVARFAARQGLTGAEFLAGIPGTMGGALAMNSGAFGGETWGRVVIAETIERNGTLHRRAVKEFKVSYRSVEPPGDEGFVGALLELEPCPKEVALEKIRTLLSRRNSTQPVGMRSCGSVFRNPSNDYAARLIERSGLKGHCIGGACVSEKHANFIINTGNASAGDIEALIHLITEVQIVGEQAQ
jgi:UDP-N-acetylmuramate dehydrogenase